MIWADRIGVGILVLAVPLAVIPVFEDGPHAFFEFMLGALMVSVAIWLPCRVLDFILTGSVRRSVY